MRALRAALAALAALLATCGAAAAAPIVSLQDDNLVNVSGPALDARLDALAATGAKATRVNVLWREVAPTRPADARDPADPAYDWSRYDQIVRGLAARGVVTLMDFYLTPEWASRSGSPTAAPRAADGARFAAALARRYSGTFAAGGAPLPEVRRIEVWNEPNLPGFWNPQCRRGPRGKALLVSPSAYASLLAASYREIKAANPRAIVVGGAAGPAGSSPTACPKDERTAVGSLDFVRRVADEGPPIDAWSMHIYPIGSPLQAFFVPSWSTLPQVIRQVDRLAPGAPIHITETGYHTSYNRFHRYFVSEEQQAAWVDETMVAASRNPRVQLVTWFNFQDNPRWTGGLLRADGTRKPAYARFAAAAAAFPPPPGWGPSSGHPGRLGQVQAYYDRLAPRLVAVEDRNWHLQSRMSLVLETIDRHARPGGRVLDVGCGTGFLLERLAERGYSGIGVNLSPESVAHAQRRLAEIGAADRLSAVVGSAYEPPEGPFDLICLTDVLEHLEDPRACVRALAARLAPGGLVVVSTPNRRSLPGARRWLAERGVPGIRLNLAPVDRWQTWVNLESHGAAAGLVPVARRGAASSGPAAGSARRSDGSTASPRRAARSSRCRGPPPGGSASTSAWGSGASDLSGDGSPRDGRARRAGVVVAIVALFVLGLAVFVLPFAFPTPPPVVTRFNATRLFSPDGDGRRENAKVNVRLSEPAAVTVEVQKDGATVRRLITDRTAPRGWVREDWDGRDDDGRVVPDGTYALKLRAHAGKKQFNTTRARSSSTPRPPGRRR